MVKAENDSLKEKLKQMAAIKPYVSSSATMNRIFQLIERVADTNATVLLHGESGTGKSMFARMIHDLSGRSKEPFITVNCAAIPEQLLESELFGYEKGAFTGAAASRQGKFEAAEKGTIFLDEIGEISPSLQAKLLQVTQEKTFMRLGSNQLRRVDVRIISATNRNLREMVQSGKFREDLYYRLNIVDIHIPPLRERKEDIPVLVEFFLERHREKTGKKFSISKELMELLKEYPWPGNVREVENAIERAVVLCREERISLEDFPLEIREFRHKLTYDPTALQDSQESFSLSERLNEFESSVIQKVLQECHGNAAAAARKLGLSRQNLLYKMNKYQINAKDFSRNYENS
jgi:transcriptional regulator with PAS, ATPase and Fis domain